MSISRHPKGIPTGGRFAAQHHAEADISLDISLDSEPANHWNEGVAGKQLLGFPGSEITDVRPSASYLTGGPDTHRDNDFNVSVRLGDGREVTLAKPWRWLDKQRSDPDSKVTS